MSRSDTGQAAGLGVAVALGNVVSLVFSVVVARLLGSDDFGSLAALLSAFFILSIAGTALQTSVARDVAAGRLTGSVRPWVRTAALWAAGLTALAVLGREQIADVLGVDAVWGAAATVPIAALWMIVSLQRGALQGTGAYGAVGQSIVWEAAGRLVLGLALVAAGAGTTGAFVGHGIALLVIAAVLDHMLANRDPGEPFRAIVRAARVPALSLVLLAVLQNVDVIVVKHQVSDDASGAYAAASLAAKSVVWIAVGLGLYLLPETSRRAVAGEPTTGLYARTVGLAIAAAVPIVLVFAVAGEPLLEITFGDEYGQAGTALPLLGLAMTFLAVTYLSVQYLLGLRRTSFLWVLAAGAALEPIVVVAAGDRLTAIALALGALQLALAAVLLAAGTLRARAIRS